LGGKKITVKSGELWLTWEKQKKITELNAVIYRCFLDVFTKSKAAKRSLSVCMSVWIFTK